MLTLPHLTHIRNIDVRLYETIKTLQDEINGQHVQGGNSHVGSPPTIAQVTVTAQNGFFSIQILDPAGAQQNNLGLHYFVDWALDANFSNPTTEDISAARGELIYLGNVTAYFRAYSQFRNSTLRSPFVYYGGAHPIGVAGGGTVGGGTPPGGGSGGQGGGGGFGGGFNRPAKQ